MEIVMLDQIVGSTPSDDTAESLRRLRGGLQDRQNALLEEAKDLLEDHLTAMMSLHPELSDAVGVVLGVLLDEDYGTDALRPALQVLGLAAPDVAGRAAALYDLCLLLEDSDLGRLRWRGLYSFEIELGLRERWMSAVKERLAQAFGGAAQKAVLEAVAEREERLGLDAADD
jgi:hypothetical protein